MKSLIIFSACCGSFSNGFFFPQNEAQVYVFALLHSFMIRLEQQNALAIYLRLFGPDIPTFQHVTVFRTQGCLDDRYGLRFT